MVIAVAALATSLIAVACPSPQAPNGAAPNAGAPTPGASAGGPVADAVLTVLPRNGTQSGGPGSGRFEAGWVDPVRTPSVTQLFTLRNDMNRSVTVARLRFSCSCQSAALLKGGERVRQVDLAPGEQVDVRVGVDISQLRMGVKRVFIWAFSPGGTKPLATMEILARIDAPVDFDPPVLAFGAVASREGASIPFTAYLDVRLAPGGKMLDLKSTNPAVIVEPDAPEERVTRPERTVLLRRYRAVLSPGAPIGLLDGELRFTPVADRALRAADRALLAGARTLISGEVTGALMASPSTLVFSTVKGRRPPKQEVSLLAPSAQTLASLRASSDSPALSVKLGAVTPPMGAGTRATRTMEVAVVGKPAVSAEPLRIRVVSEAGEMVLITVIMDNQ